MQLFFNKEEEFPLICSVKYEWKVLTLFCIHRPTQVDPVFILSAQFAVVEGFFVIKLQIQYTLLFGMTKEYLVSTRSVTEIILQLSDVFCKIV